MASTFLRGKQTGMQNDLSASIAPEALAPDDVARYGINSQISCLAYDPVQSLLAVATNESQFGAGKISVFGHTRVNKTLEPTRRTSFRVIRFAANRLISLDTKNEIAVWDLDAGQRVAGQVISGNVVSLVTDPLLDWAFLGLANGDVLAYDLDRERVATSFRLPNFWREHDPSARAVGLVSISLHPTDIGKLLIAYTTGVVMYSFKQNTPQKYFEYVLQPGAPGGNGGTINSVRKPRLTHAVWHPTGTFFLTAHDDGSLAFWDPRDGRLLTARTLENTKVDQPGRNDAPPTFSETYSHIAWCCKANADDTGLLIAGGQSPDSPQRGMTFIDLGPSPVYATSSWQILQDHFQGKRQNVLTTPAGADVSDFLLIPRTSPHYGGSHDPIAVLTLLNSGELITMSFPSGYPISPTNQLHPSLSLVHPYVSKFAVQTVERSRWLSMTETRNQGEPILKGGAEANRPSRKFHGRTVVQVAHGDGTVRLWDAGSNDEMENPRQLQVDLARALDRFEDVEVTAMHMASNTGEFAVGTRTGEVVLYRWGMNRSWGRDDAQPLDPNPGGLTDVSARAEPALKEGLLPKTLYEMSKGPITALCVSDVGFVAVGSEGGVFSIVDLRGPAVLFQTSLAEFVKKEKRSSFLKSSSSSGAPSEWPVAIEFGVMTLEGDNYSSICCFVGTNLGKVLTFKLLPSGGGYSAKFAGLHQGDGKVVALCPIVADTGRPAEASGEVVAGLRDGRQVNGVMVAVTQSEISVFKPASGKGASKSFDNSLCDAAAVSECELRGTAVVGVFGDRTVRAFSIPGLKELKAASLPMLDGSRTTNAAVTRPGMVLAWAGPSELALLSAWGAAQPLPPSLDVMVNPELITPARPVISNIQWLSGTQYVSPTDMDLLIAPDRPPSKRMRAAAAAEQQAARGGGGGVQSGTGAGTGAGGSQEGWGDYLTRQLNERTEKLNLMGDNMDNLQGQSQGWAHDANQYMNKQKRSFVMGSIKNKFF